jgi:hypothetical protein
MNPSINTRALRLITTFSIDQVPLVSLAVAPTFNVPDG